MKTIFRIFAIGLILLIQFPSSAEDIHLKRVGLMPFKGEGFTSDQLKAITAKFQNEIFKSNKFQLMEQEKVQAILEEKGLAESGCTETNCFVDIGHAVGVDCMLFGNISHISEVTSISVKIVDVGNGQIVKSAILDTKDNIARILDIHIKELALNIAGSPIGGAGVYAFDPTKKREPIAIIKLDANGIKENEAQGFTDRLRAEMFNTGAFQVMERDQMNAILKEQGFQQTGACTEQSCLVAMGQLVGVRYIIGGSVTHIGNTFSVSARIIDVSSGKIVRVATEDTRHGLEQVLKNTMGDIAKGLAGMKIKRTIPPGSAICLGLAAIAGAGAGYSYYTSGNYYDQYMNERFNADKIRSYKASSQRYLIYTNICIGAAAGSALLSGFFFFRAQRKIEVLEGIAFCPREEGASVTIYGKF
jgi:curli biogenesis system outer membrane secretion channel CsgG